MSLWTIILVDEVEDWFLELCKNDPDSGELVEAAINTLELEGPNLGRPLVDRIKGSTYHNMKELRPGSAGNTEIRILFAFDPVRQAILLVAGDKTGNWKGWYEQHIPIADKRYEEHLKELKGQQ
ncbi:MAG TPA: type II toxin-antitoxin system RelE/ParE family toxin [Micromonosporaceae bacterium]|nr:type II toxin-antitoxin system RelE/ParE family toxin [Micromonosporaceae bacterium]